MVVLCTVAVDDAPATMHRALTQLTTLQRLGVYQHCVGRARDANQQTSIPLDQLQLLDDSLGEGRAYTL